MTNPDQAARGLREAVESVRGHGFTELDQELVAEILDIQLSFAENRAEGRKQTEQAVTRFVTEHASMDSKED